MSEPTLTEAEATAVVNEVIDLDGRSGERVTVAELEERVEALGVPRAKVREVLALRDQRAKEEAQRVKEAQRARAQRVAAVRDFVSAGWKWATGALSFVALIAGFVALNLDGDRDKVAEAQEKVYAALGRQQTIIASAPSISDPLNRDAEVAGAANRVYVAKNDYDHAVSVYNSDAGDLSWVLRVFPVFPLRFPYAREVWR